MGNGMVPATAIAGAILFFCFAGESILNPNGFFNFVFCSMIDVLAYALPSTPTGYKIADLMHDFFLSYSVIGVGIFADLFQTLFVYLALFVTVKLVKFVKG